MTPDTNHTPAQTHRPGSIRLLLLALLLLPLAVQAQWTPEKPSRLVNDYSAILTPNQREVLESRLVALDDSTSNQIAIVITPTLHGDDENAVAQRIGQAWGVGRNEFDNGLVILIKSKTVEENWGAVAIATGYGLEGALPDIFCRHIIDEQMLPALGDGDYYRALTQALDVIEPVVRGEYSYAQYRRDGQRDALTGMLITLSLMAIAIILIRRYAKKHPDQFNNNNNRRGGGGIYIGGFPGMWGSGGMGGGFGGGGFGGFGGGGFGGGGASGRF
ncbi:MAG: TPM domain-containing protein [Bacteroidales bacterium]|nr:TPM domain-containing protein [Bacteroidales bacterium]